MGNQPGPDRNQIVPMDRNDQPLGRRQDPPAPPQPPDPPDPRPPRQRAPARQLPPENPTRRQPHRQAKDRKNVSHASAVLPNRFFGHSHTSDISAYSQNCPVNLIEQNSHITERSEEMEEHIKFTRQYFGRSRSCRSPKPNRPTHPYIRLADITDVTCWKKENGSYFYELVLLQHSGQYLNVWVRSEQVQALPNEVISKLSANFKLNGYPRHKHASLS